VDAGHVCSRFRICRGRVASLGRNRGAGHGWWRGRSAVVQLSRRHEMDDRCWCALFHQAGHLLAGRHASFVDGAGTVDDAEEQAADGLAWDILVSPKDWTAFVSAGVVDSQTIRAFAQDQRIAPGWLSGGCSVSVWRRARCSLTRRNPHQRARTAAECGRGVVSRVRGVALFSGRPACDRAPTQTQKPGRFDGFHHA
jgi:hypothetical protein